MFIVEEACRPQRLHLFLFSRDQVLQAVFSCCCHAMSVLWCVCGCLIASKLLRAGWSGVYFAARQEIFSTTKTSRSAVGPTYFQINGYNVQSCRGGWLTTHLHLLLNLRRNGAIPLVSLYSSAGSSLLFLVGMAEILNVLQGFKHEIQKLRPASCKRYIIISLYPVPREDGSISCPRDFLSIASRWTVHKISVTSVTTDHRQNSLKLKLTC